MAEGARLESVFRGNSNVGSNPTLSASSMLRVGARATILSSFADQRRHELGSSLAGRVNRAGQPSQMPLPNHSFDYGPNLASF